MTEPDKLYHGTTWLAVVSFILLILTLAGCATPGAVAPVAPPRTSQAVGLHSDVAVPEVDAMWWQAFGDEGLNALVAQALAEQPSLQQAAARLVQARAAAEGVMASAAPQLSATGTASRQRYSANGLFPAPIAGSYLNAGNLQASAGWSLDFFGRNRAALQAALGAQRAAEADRAAARSVLAAQVTHGWLGLARLLAQRDVAARALVQRQDMLSLIRQRVQAGLDTTVELRQGEGALPDTRSQIEALDEQLALLRHQLAALSAQPPQALDEARPQLAALQAGPLPAELGAALGTDLLGRRADVAAARWRIDAAAGGVAGARAEFYPDIRLSAFVGLDAIGLDRWLDLGSRALGAGPALHLPLFDGGALRAHLRGRTAELDGAIGQYDAALLQAVHEVADALSTQQSVERQRREQASAQASAESAYDLALQRYRAGIGNYLVVLNAESQVLAQRRLGVDLQARALDTQVALAQSLGGGWHEAAATH